MSLPRLVFLPGTLCTEATFAFQVEGLSEVADVTVIPLREGSSIAASARWVLEQVTGSFTLVGFSQGAIVALEIMRVAPEWVTRLCLMSANPKGSTPEQLETWAGWQAATRAGRFAEIAVRFSDNIHPGHDDEQLAKTINDMAFEVGPDIFIKQLDALASRIDSRPYLGNIRCPTLLLAGRHDRVTPFELHSEMHSLIPDAALVPVEDSGHYLPLEQPQAVTAVLRYWLQTTQPPV